MPIFIAMLLKQGLGLIANAAMAKGTDYIKEKTGVDLTAGQPTPEQLNQLKQFQLEHEEELIKLQQADKQLDLQVFQTETADTANARARELAIVTSANTQGGEMFLERNITSILALIVVLGGGILIFFGDVNLRGMLIPVVTLVLGYYFGTTQASKRKDATIAKIAEAP